MARKRPIMPSIASIKGLESIGNDAEKGILAASKRDQAQIPTTGGIGPSGAVLTARARAQRNMTYELAMAMQSAKAGDDSELLPYQPTPSINPPRPRTLAAGYDRNTQVMRIRFRDGALYGYGNVSPREWRNFRRVKSPGRAINRTYNYKEYWRES